MQQRRGTSEQWTLADPTLGPGEIGFETDTNQFKIGDGVNSWADLTYFVNLDGLGEQLEDYIPIEEKGEPDGVATLDATGQVPAEQLGNATVDLSDYATEEYVDGLAANYEVAGAAAQALSDAEDYADGLAANYDAAGSATTAESNANSYTDDLIGDATVDGTSGNTVTDRISTAVSDLVSSAPEALDTLNELAAALGDDENFSTTITKAIADKADSSHTHGLADLTDFDVDTPVENQVLKFDGTAWINAAAGGGIQASEEPPTDTEAFPLWFNTTTGRAYIYYDDFWVELTPSISGPQGEKGRFTVSETAPENPVAGDGWFNSSTAKLFVYYDSFWVEATSNLVGPAGPSGVVAVTSPITNSGTSTSANIGIDLSNIAPISNPTFTGTITGAPAAPTAATSASRLGFIGLPQTILSSGGLTLSEAHSGNHIYVTGSGQTITIPANSSVPFEIGTTIVVINDNVTSSIAITSDTLRLAGGTTTGTRSLAVYGMATLVKVTATSWVASGNGLT
jgi:hypothetical protein